MSNYYDLVNGIEKNTNLDEYLKKFFSKSNFKNYECFESATEEDVKSIRILFESNKPFTERISKVLKVNPFCIEALFLYVVSYPPVFIDQKLEAYYDSADKFAKFTEYQKDNYFEILNLYSEFLQNINNITKSILVDKLIVKFYGYADKLVDRLAYDYFTLEDEENFYRLYADTDLSTYAYLLLINTLLKHNDKLRAKEVLFDFFDNVEYATYLDHVWDLKEDDVDQKEFAEIVNDCNEDLMSVPTFYSFVYETKQSYLEKQ